MSYPKNLWADVLEQNIAEIDLPKDWEETLAWIREDGVILPHHFDSLILRYKDGLSMGQIAQGKGVSKQCISLWQQKTLENLRHYYVWVMYYGKHREEHLRTNRMLRWATDNRPLSELKLESGTIAMLERCDIWQISQLCKCTVTDLAQIRGLGTKKISEIKKKLSAAGYSLPEDIPDEKSLKKKRRAAACSAYSRSNPTAEISGPIEEAVLVETSLDLSTALLLRRNGIVTVGDLAAKTKAELKAIRGLGTYRMVYVEQFLLEYGLSLKK